MPEDVDQAYSAVSGTSTIGQLEYLSIMTRWLWPWWWKKSAQIHWNGYSVGVGGVGGRFACEGAILLQSVQFALVAWISFIIPGQKIAASALEIMAEVTWWDACRADRHD